MNRSIKNLRTIVTGASNGIGREIAVQLADAGARVVAVARRAEKLNEIPGVTPIVGDVTKSDDRERIISQTIRELGGLDLLVNNAGIASFGHFVQSSESINRQIFETNFFAAAELTRLAVPYLKNGVTPCVAITTSMCARRGMPAWSEYSASKFALMGLIEAWRVEFDRFGIDVVSTVPGLTNTGLRDSMLRNDGRYEIKPGQAMEAADVAAATVRAIRRRSREVWLGGETKLILFLNRFAPRLTNTLLARKVKALYSDLRSS